ncbi:hypothetical protein A9Q89_06205 [Gammaproteobacteria bacterium 53_120_T64]|nr:hypothetical protein A9Q89_06205 [Gammaproteobacteria bacterium 53_120_T64]
MKARLLLIATLLLSPLSWANCAVENANPEQNVKTCSLAASGGDADAQKALGSFYYSGQGVQQSYADALHWFTLAAAQNHAIATYNVGVLHDKGLGLEKDYKEAGKWYRKAADLGYSTAQYNLGIMYEYGQTVDEDPALAMTLYHKAAEQGEAAAQFAIGLMYDKGIGVDKDPTEAYKWWQIAGAGHPHALNNRDSIAAEMTPMQISEGKRLAQRWLDARPGLVQLPALELQ